jgi:8-oxo-dGTP pyrophosphatase MutT (NUDIX family)
MPNAENDFDLLAESLRQRLTAHRWSASCYRRFAPELSYGRHRGPAGPDAKPAAVVALFYPASHCWYLPLILRPSSMIYHPGQISLPGGGAEPGESAEACALRELHEELGVGPSGITTLGLLPPLFVYASNFLVRPLVAIARQRPVFRPDSREVAELLELPFDHLLDAGNHATHTIARGPLSFRAPCIEFQGRHIWGATALILGELLDVIGSTGRHSGCPSRVGGS